MMAYQAIFRRYELKYLLRRDEKEKLLSAMSEHMQLDRYGKSSIRNIYFDTDNYRLIRQSLEKPLYKEKLRIRSYGAADREDTVFVELKKKYSGIVYKRRISMLEADAERFIEGGLPPQKAQIAREIEYFAAFYGGLRKRLFLSYDREAYYSYDGSDFRVTFDENVLARESDISLASEVGGYPLLSEGESLMELKCSGGIPMWMARALSENKIYKTSFSKYGRAYEKMILPHLDKIYNTKE